MDDSVQLERLLDSFGILMDEAQALSFKSHAGRSDPARDGARRSMLLLRARDLYERMRSFPAAEEGSPSPAKKAGESEKDPEAPGFSGDPGEKSAALRERIFLCGVRLASHYARSDRVPEASSLYGDLEGRARSPKEIAAAAALGRRLAMAHLRAGESEKASALYRRLTALGVNRAAKVEVFKAAFYIVSYLAKRGERREALWIYETLPEMSPEPGDGAPRRARASLTLVGGAGSPKGEGEGPEGALPPAGPPSGISLVGSAPRPSGEDGEAAAAWEGSLEPGPTLSDIRAHAAVNVLSGYATGGDPEEARRVFDGLFGPDSDPSYESYRTVATLNLLNVYAAAGRFPEAEELRRSLEAEDDGSVYFLAARAKALADLAVLYGNAGLLETALERYKEIGDPDSPAAVRRHQADALASLVYNYGERKRLDEASLFFDSLLSDFEDSPHLRRLRAQAAACLVCDFCLLPDLRKAGEIYREMEPLGDSEWFSARKAKALFNLVAAHARDGETSLAMLHYARLDALPPHPEVFLEKARACFNLVTELGLSGRLDQARDVYARLAAIPESEAVVLERSKATVNLVGFLGNAGRHREAGELYRGMLSKASFPGVAPHLGKAAFNLVFDLGRDGLFEEAAEILSGMEALGRDEGVLADRALSAHRLILHLLDADDPEAAMEIRRSLDSLGDSPRVSRERAKAAVSLLHHFGFQGDLDRASEIYQSLSALGDGDEVVLETARGGFKLVSAFIRVGNARGAGRIFHEMARLGRAPDVLEERAKAGVNLVSVFGSMGRLDEARAVMRELDGFPDEPRLSVLRAKAAFNLIIDLVKSGFLDESRELYLGLRELSSPDELLLPRGRLGVILVRSFAKAGRFGEAEELLAGMDSLGEAKEMRRLRESAAFELKCARSALNYPRIRGLGKDV
ncbi:MAG: hypothetical protein LBR53_09810 [Deltaproteobacteria bacterium]|jgi:pentatricopeptide repeat protein|nr:hypothetical protein [Deltaproteobacteria bacterium]